MQRFLTSLLIAVCLVSPVPVREAFAEEGPLASELARAEDLLKERKFDDALAVLRQVVAQREEDQASAAMAQYRLGLYLNWTKAVSKHRPEWVPTIEQELRKVVTDFPEQTEAVHLARERLVGILLEQAKRDEAQQVAQTLFDTTAEWPQYNASGRLWLAEIPLSYALVPGTKGDERRAAFLAAIPQLQQIVADTPNAYPEVANRVRLRLLYVLVFTWQFDMVPAVS